MKRGSSLSRGSGTQLPDSLDIACNTPGRGGRRGKEGEREGGEGGREGGEGGDMADDKE